MVRKSGIDDHNLMYEEDIWKVACVSPHKHNLSKKLCQW